MMMMMMMMMKHFALIFRFHLTEIGRHLQPPDTFPGLQIHQNTFAAGARPQTYFGVYLEPRKRVWWLQLIKCRSFPLEGLIAVPQTL